MWLKLRNVTDAPEKGRGTTEEGRARGLPRRNLEAGSVPNPSPPDTKVLTDRPDPAVEFDDGSCIAGEPPGGSGGGAVAGRRARRRSDRKEARHGRAGNDGGRCGREAVPSAGWREVAEALEAEEGQGHR